MTDTNRKEMLAGLFLSKFSAEGLKRLGYKSFKDAYVGLSNLVGGNPLSVRNYRDEFDPVFPNGRKGYHGRKMMPSRKAMLDKFGAMGLEEMADLLEEQYLGTEKFIAKLDEALSASEDGAEVARQAEKAGVSDITHFLSGDIDPDSAEGKERIATTKVRVTQAQFRRWIFSIYGGRCCLTGLAVPSVLRASHIVAWSEDVKNRMNPSNGLCLSATYDAAFDRHLISFDEDCRLILSKSIREFCTDEIHKSYFLAFEGHKITMPSRFAPDEELLEQHRDMLVA